MVFFVSLFVFGTWKMLFHFFLASVFFNEKFVVIRIPVSSRQCIVSLWLLLIFFFFVFSFQVFIIIFLGMNFFGFIYLGFIQLLKSVYLDLMPNLISFQQLFLQIPFQSHVLHFLLLGIWWYKCISFLVF